ncbi:hypothetical protein [Paenibacillus tarimensis]|uniref:hypothetical protein n=1 Tax=Paenibacillus tarimensis TaxID=416012 RepID=UPI001F2B8A52|nr:hypothetical protein [Paenibacillus tarimensis]MCF2944588.1 hypothetical protein [Paenibacillus tarimensis]
MLLEKPFIRNNLFILHCRQYAAESAASKFPSARRMKAFWSGEVLLVPRSVRSIRRLRRRLRRVIARYP